APPEAQMGKLLNPWRNPGDSSGTAGDPTEARARSLLAQAMTPPASSAALRRQTGRARAFSRPQLPREACSRHALGSWEDRTVSRTAPVLKTTPRQRRRSAK